MFKIKILEFGFVPYIIGTRYNNYNIEFINKTTNLIIIRKNFKEIKKNDFDILMVNSDQTWRKFDQHFYDYGFLRFAKNWNIKKFVYGASIGFDYWPFTKREDKIMRNLLKNFNGISVREKGSINLIKKHLGITPEFVLDPTFLINKKYYLELIKDYKFNKTYNNNYIFIYTLSNYTSFNYINEFIKMIKNKLNLKIYDYKLHNYSKIEDFIYYIYNCKAVVTNSFHGTVFSILFNKSFVSFHTPEYPKERLKSLGSLLNIQNRIFNHYQKPDINLLNTPLDINKTLLDYFINKSINFLKKNLDIS